MSQDNKQQSDEELYIYSLLKQKGQIEKIHNVRKHLVLAISDMVNLEKSLSLEPYASAWMNKNVGFLRKEFQMISKQLKTYEQFITNLKEFNYE